MSEALSYPPAPPARVLAYPKAGDVARIRNDADIVEPMMVFAPCDGRFTLYCIDHETPLANWSQLEMHIEQGGSHTLVRQCRVHGRPESLSDRERADLVHHQQLESGI